jgi:hypothetical protein
MLEWDHDQHVCSSISLFSQHEDDEQNIIKQADTLHPDHTVVEVNRAPWLDKPAEAEEPKTAAKGELVAVPQSLPVYVPEGYKLVPIHLSFTSQIAGRDALDETDTEASFSTDQVVACWDAILKQL